MTSWATAKQAIRLAYLDGMDTRTHFTDCYIGKFLDTFLHSSFQLLKITPNVHDSQKAWTENGKESSRLHGHSTY